MSKEIIEKHMNGSLSVKNEKYVYKDKSYIGATFLIIFPNK